MGYGKILMDQLKSKGSSISTVAAGAGIPKKVEKTEEKEGNNG